MKFGRLLSGAAATCVVILAAAGCSGGTAEGVAADLNTDNFAAELSEATTQQRSTHLEATVSFQDKSMTMSGDIAFGPSKKLADLKAQMTMEVTGQGALEMRIVDSAFYLRSDELTTDSGKPWGRVDLSDPTNPMAMFYAQLITYTNPADHIEMFQAVTELDNKGEERVDGVQATHYEVTVDLRKALKLTGLYDDMGSKAGGIASELPDEVTYDVWVASETALMVRMSMDLAGADIDLHFSEWGEAISVEAPPAAQVTDFDF